jgi:hypothetical protein
MSAVNYVVGAWYNSGKPNTPINGLIDNNHFTLPCCNLQNRSRQLDIERHPAYCSYFIVAPLSREVPTSAGLRLKRPTGEPFCERITKSYCSGYRVPKRHAHLSCSSVGTITHARHSVSSINNKAPLWCSASALLCMDTTVYSVTTPLGCWVLRPPYRHT